jgi:hypothetical protein
MQTQTIKIDPKRLKLLKLNARYMRHETFMRLVENVKKDKALTSVPFCAILDYYQEGDPIPRHEDTGEPVYEVLSGNHRVKAAISAGLAEIEVMVTDDPLSPDQRKAIQLSHNELTGEDDPATLKLIYESIQDLDLRLYSGLDDKKLELLAEVKPGSLNEAHLEFQPLTMIFLPDELDGVNELMDTVKTTIKGAKATWITRWSDYDKYMDALEDASRSHGVKNVATALMVILEVFSRHITELQEGFLDENLEPIKEIPGYVPLSAIFGENIVPPKTASAIRKAIAKKKGDGKKAHFEALEAVIQAGLDAMSNKP